MDWRLFTPLSWDDEVAGSQEAAGAVQARREVCKIPAGEHHRPKWRMAIEMLDELAEWGYRPPVVAADAGYGDTTAFRLALEERNIGYVVAVKGRKGPQSRPYWLIPSGITHLTPGWSVNFRRWSSSVLPMMLWCTV